MGNSSFSRITALLVLLHLTCAVPWVGPAPTPTGLLAKVGISLLPTKAPSLDGIPRELLRRDQVPFPPPLSWCGFIDGNPSNVLSCVSTKTCVSLGTVIGCCDVGLTATCDNIHTTCLNYGDSCGAACKSDSKILKCSSAALKYCGTFNFDAGNTHAYDCRDLPHQVSTVEFIADYYLSQLGSSLGNLIPSLLGGSQTLLPFLGIVATTTLVVTAAGSGQIDSSSSSSSGLPTKSSSGMPLTTIIGIAVGGGGGLVCIIAGLVTFCCIRRRNRNRRKGPYNPVGIALPMQQQFPKVEKPTFGSQYASVSQIEQLHDEHQSQNGEGINKAFDPIPARNMPSSPAPSHLTSPPFSSMERNSRHSSPGPEARFSAAPTTASMSEQGHGNRQYQQIHHPSVSEVDGDIYRGAPSHSVTEVEANTPPLNHGYEMEGTGLSGVFEMGPGRQARSLEPTFNGPYEMEHRGYAQ